MTRRPLFLGFIAALSVLVVTSGPANAQQRLAPDSGARSATGMRDQEQRRQVMARVQAEHERRLVEALGITPTQGTDLRALLRRFRESRMELMLERSTIREDLLRHGGAGGSESEAQRILDRMRELRAREVEMQRAEEEALLQILSPTQILQMQILRDRFSEQIRQLERGRSGRRPPEAGPGGREGVSSR